MGNYYYYYQLILFQATQLIRTVLPDTHSNNDKRPGARFNKEVQPTLEFKLELRVELLWDGKLWVFAYRTAELC